MPPGMPIAATAVRLAADGRGGRQGRTHTEEKHEGGVLRNDTIGNCLDILIHGGALLS